MVLGYSCMMFVEFTEDQRPEIRMGCHERAIRFFSGVIETCFYVNIKNRI